MPYLAAAFTGVWLLVTGYVVYISTQQRKLERDLRALQENADDPSSPQINSY